MPRKTAKPPKVKYRSFIALVRATGGPELPYHCRLLIGGVPKTQSLRYSERNLAEIYLERTLECSRDAGRPCEGEIKELTVVAEAIYHCDYARKNVWMTGAGDKCCCGQIVTKSDVLKASLVPEEAK